MLTDEQINDIAGEYRDELKALIGPIAQHTHKMAIEKAANIADEMAQPNIAKAIRNVGQIPNPPESIGTSYAKTT